MITRSIHNSKAQGPIASLPLSPAYFAWSVCMHGIASIGTILAFFFSNLQPYFWNRGLKHAQNFRNLVSAKHKDRYLFFCSSAGEYEQGLPLARKLENAGNDVIICFFSLSGYQFAQARKEKRYFFLSPIDSYWSWKRVFRALKPKASFVVRHEVWPGFLKLASSWNEGVFLINASKSLSAKSQVQHRLKSKLFKYFRKIYFVSQHEQTYFTQNLQIPAQKLICTGDSKYDSVFERSMLKKAEAGKHQDLLDQFGKVDSRLVLGSAWEKDVELGLGALADLRQQVNKSLQVMVALHKPEEPALTAVEQDCQKLKLSFRRLSTMLPLQDKPQDIPRAPYDVIIVDSVGILSELYCCGQLAFIGGALHYQVHNVLEPAFYALALAYGPLYKNSGEAVLLAEAKVISIIKNKNDLAKWWTDQIHTGYENGQRANALIKSYLGATEEILADLKAEHIFYDGKTTDH
ncbi:MAG: 3-deoxy-D-manno-octulosonic acid transferase [Oligoflexales bacterium]